MAEDQKESLEARVERIETLVQENNKILHHIRMIQRIHYAWTGLRIGLILVGVGLVYYYVTPYVMTIAGVYRDVQSSTEKINSLQQQLEPLMELKKRFGL